MASSPPTSRSGTPSRQTMNITSDRSSPRETKQKSPRHDKKTQHETFSNDAMSSPSYHDRTKSDRSDVTEGRGRRRTDGQAKASDSGVVTDYTIDSPTSSRQRPGSRAIRNQPELSMEAVSDLAPSNPYRKSSGRRLTMQKQQKGMRKNAQEDRVGDLRSRPSSSHSWRQEDDDRSHTMGGASAATVAVPSRQQHQRSPSSSSSQHRVRSRGRRGKKSSEKQLGSSIDGQRPLSRESQDMSLDKTLAVQDRRRNEDPGFNDGLTFDQKNTVLPDKFTSVPLLEQLGLDEDDVHKLMKAYGEYNKIMAKGNQPPTDFGAILDSQSLQEEGCISSSTNSSDSNEPVPPSSPPKDKGHHPEADETASSSSSSSSEGELVQNNIKCEPPKPERTLRDLVGKTIDKAGNILDNDGQVIGKVNPDLSYLDGKTVNEDGDVVDEYGKIYGKAEVVSEPKTTDSKGKKPGSSFKVASGDDDLIVNVDAHKGGISFSIHIPRPK